MTTDIPSTTIANTQLFQRIYEHITTQPLTDGVSLLGGQMGYAMLEAYTQRFFGLPTSERTWERIAASLGAVQANELIHSFAAGVAGVSWGFLHLANQGMLISDEFDPQDIVADLDEPLFDVSMELLREGDFDYLHGGLSACLYYLERLSTPAITHFVDQIVRQLSTLAVRYPNGDITWIYKDNYRQPAGDPVLYNLGLSHGTPSIVAVLSLLYERGYARPQCAELIQGSLQWLWNRRNRAGYSMFPHIVSDEHQDAESRLAWCYGDLGVASTFWLAGEKLGLPIWQIRAEEIMLKASPRRTIDRTMVRDAGICHGSAGNAYLFRKFANRTQHPLLVQAADYWLGDVANYVQSDGQDDIFLSFEAGQYVTDRGLLGGTTGIGLVLLSELGVPTPWDRLLLLS